jgi:hypothetical protein
MSHFDLRANLIERRTVEVDADLAKHYLGYNTYKYQRPTRQAHVEDIAEKIIDGRFRFGDIAFAVYNGQDIMMNGQHQCQAIISTGKTVPCILEKYKCGSEMDMADLFMQFENLPRSMADMVAAKAGALNLPWAKAIANVVVSAAGMEQSAMLSSNQQKLKAFKIQSSGSINNPRKSILTKEERVNLLERYIKEGIFLNKVCSGDQKTSRHILKAPVAYVMFLTMRKNENDAYNFWMKVKTGENLTRNMPEMRLREFLLSVYSHASKFSFRTARPHEYIYRCVLAWNSFRTNTPTKLSYSPDRDIPAVK